MKSDFWSIENKQDVTQLHIEVVQPESDHRSMARGLLDRLEPEVRELDAQRLRISTLSLTIRHVRRLSQRAEGHKSPFQ